VQSARGGNVPVHKFGAHAKFLTRCLPLSSFPVSLERSLLRETETITAVVPRAFSVSLSRTAGTQWSGPNLQGSVGVVSMTGRPRIPGIQPALNLQRCWDAHRGATALDPSLAAPRSYEPRHIVRKAGLTCRISATWGSGVVFTSSNAQSRDPGPRKFTRKKWATPSRPGPRQSVGGGN